MGKVTLSFLRRPSSLPGFSINDSGSHNGGEAA